MSAAGNRIELDTRKHGCLEVLAAKFSETHTHTRAHTVHGCHLGLFLINIALEATQELYQIKE